jgi:hypothetical protein
MRRRLLTSGFLVFLLTAPFGIPAPSGIAAPLGLSIRVQAQPRMALSVTPEVARAPADMEIHATISHASGDRTLTVIAESSSFYRSSEIQLGEHSPASWVFRYRDLPEGNYDITATITSAGGATRSLTKVARIV